ncbi:NADPH-dependent F420 reductase [Sphingobacteriales bacterium CHB3]|nr:NADPH-dependent F420 reductase [Sphingobacteriales bacterium CHB3]
MNIAVVGAGNIGGRLARVWAAKGHRILVGTRNPAEEKIVALMRTSPERITAHSPRAAAQHAGAILISVPASAAFNAVQELGDIKGRIIIDAMNAVFRKPEPYTRTSEAIVAASGNDHIVKCFNWIGAENIENPMYGNVAADMILCGNYAADKSVTQRLAEECGFVVYDIGGMDKEQLIENAAALWSSLAYGTGLGRGIAFKVLRR